MRQDQNIELFKAAFYADLNVLQKLIVGEADMQVKVPILNKELEECWVNEYVEINVLEILNWAAFGFYEYFDENDLCVINSFPNDNQTIKTCINPSEYYNNVMNCIVWFCEKFAVNNYLIKDYSKYRFLRHFLFDDENWLDEDEMNEAITRGYKEIDLNLINEAEKGNGMSCYSLVQKGADYKIDPVDFTEESAIVDILGTDMSFHKLEMISYLSDRNKWDETDAYDMLSSLYQVGVSNYILDIVMTKES
jgi:hypothetical protein